MAQVPVEILAIGDLDPDVVRDVVAISNVRQKEFLFSINAGALAAQMSQFAFQRASAPKFLDELERARTNARGFHPFVIAMADFALDGAKYGNLFGSHRAEKGLALVTTHGVPVVIIPKSRMAAYLVYYLARYALSFLAPVHRNHEDPRNCVFDRKIDKRDIVKSMRARALCDECRTSLLAGAGSISPDQFQALQDLFALSGKLLNDVHEPDFRPRIFIGSASEGLARAEILQELLSPDYAVDIWNQESVIALGDATLEALEGAVSKFQFGVVLLTPDDKLSSRGETRPVGRDNVLFELGMFIGKLGRKRAFAVHPGKNTIALPSDLNGISTAIYDPTETDQRKAFEPVAKKIQRAIKAAISA